MQHVAHTSKVQQQLKALEQGCSQCKGEELQELVTSGGTYALKACTVNVTTGKELKRFLRHTEANLVFVQEHKLRGCF